MRLFQLAKGTATDESLEHYFAPTSTTPGCASNEMGCGLGGLLNSALRCDP